MASRSMLSELILFYFQSFRLRGFGCQAKASTHCVDGLDKSTLEFVYEKLGTIYGTIVNKKFCLGIFL